MEVTMDPYQMMKEIFNLIESFLENSFKNILLLIPQYTYIIRILKSVEIWDDASYR